MELEYGESKLETNVRVSAGLVCPLRTHNFLVQVFSSLPEIAAVKPFVVAMQHILRCVARSRIRSLFDVGSPPAAARSS